ncbi:MAG: putative SnoaL-like aldol condensation-catalyzing enzyme [Bradymonadia bacterium]
MSTEENTANATAFYDLMFNEYQPAEAIKRFVGDEYIQHKTELGDGK